MLLSKGILTSLMFTTKLILILTSGTTIASGLLLGYFVYLGGDPFAPSLSEVWDPSADNLDVGVLLPLISSLPTVHEFRPGIRQPPTQRAEKTQLADDAEVIGVCVEGRARAYSVSALSCAPGTNVVNDVLAGYPVSVSFCDRTRHVRVFTIGSTSAPLELNAGGWQQGKGMILQIGGVDYALEDGENLTDPNGPPLPYQTLQHERTTWGEWRRAHPQSDVYFEPRIVPSDDRLD